MGRKPAKVRLPKIFKKTYVVQPKTKQITIVRYRQPIGKGYAGGTAAEVEGKLSVTKKGITAREAQHRVKQFVKKAKKLEKMRSRTYKEGTIEIGGAEYAEIPQKKQVFPGQYYFKRYTKGKRKGEIKYKKYRVGTKTRVLEQARIELKRKLKKRGRKAKRISRLERARRKIRPTHVEYFKEAKRLGVKIPRKWRTKAGFKKLKKMGMKRAKEILSRQFRWA